MIKKIITDISEEDFRKLDITVHRHEKVTDGTVTRIMMVPKKLNDILDEEIKCLLESGYESDYADLLTPVTIAIHELPTTKDYEYAKERFPMMNEDDLKSHLLYEFSYLDKFMNQFTGAQTFQIGWGIRHLYSSRDYYESHDDYWKVRKNETKVIYRVKLSDSWLDKFQLKHRKEVHPWPYDFLPKGVSPKFEHAFLVINLDLKDNDEWVESSRTGEFVYSSSKHVVPVDKDGHEILHS